MSKTITIYIFTFLIFSGIIGMIIAFFDYRINPLSCSVQAEKLSSDTGKLQYRYVINTKSRYFSIGKIKLEPLFSPTLLKNTTISLSGETERDIMFFAGGTYTFDISAVAQENKEIFPEELDNLSFVVHSFILGDIPFIQKCSARKSI